MTNDNEISDPFIAVQPEDHERLLSVLKTRLPRSANVYNTLVMLQKVNLDVEIYTLKGDLSQNCWIIVFSLREDYGRDITISVPIGVAITDDIKDAFITSNIFKWNERYMFCLIDATITMMLLEISALVKGNATNTQPDYCYYMNPEDATSANTELPEGFELRSLNSEVGIDFLVKTWKYTLDGTEEYCQKIVKTCPSIGIFCGTEIAAGMILNPNGLLGMLFTSHKYRGKGLAQICMKSMAKQMAMEGLVPTSSVEFHEGTKW